VTQVVRSTKDNQIQLVVRASGRYAVKVAETVVFESRVLTAAEIYYAEEVDKHRALNRGILARERGHFDAQAVRSDAFARTSAHANRKGGKGGRGGVG
jgi:hypothetical protein